MRRLYVVQLLDLTFIGFAEPTFMSSEDYSVCGFGLSVGLRVFDGDEVLFGSELSDELLDFSVCELRVVVGH